MAREPSAKELALTSIIKPLQTAKWQCDFRWDGLGDSIASMAADYGDLEMCPDFQRGHVWSPEQQIHFIENCLRGVVATNGYLIQFNSPSWGDEGADTDLDPGLQCLDGLQRFTAVTEFVKGNIKPFGLDLAELANTQFSPKRMYMKVAVHGFTRRADLLEHYLAINAGGTPHSSEEIERVQNLLSLTRTGVSAQ